jgi:hypothetical protein
MPSAHHFLEEVITSLRTVIVPAIADPYPKAQAAMAAVLLEFVSRQVEERSDIARGKEQALGELFGDLPKLLSGQSLEGDDKEDQESRLCRVIEQLYVHRSQLGEEIFAAANTRVRQTLRQLLDEELKVAKPKD